jgi:hypothetical protein
MDFINFSLLLHWFTQFVLQRGFLVCVDLGKTYESFLPSHDSPLVSKFMDAYLQGSKRSDSEDWGSE